MSPHFGKRVRISLAWRMAVLLGGNIESFYCCTEFECVKKGTCGSQMDELCQWLIYCFLDSNVLFFVLFLILDTVSIFTLSVGLRLAFANKEFWRDTVKPSEKDTSLVPVSSFLTTWRKAGGAFLSNELTGQSWPASLSIFLFYPSGWTLTNTEEFKFLCPN